MKNLKTKYTKFLVIVIAGMMVAGCDFAKERYSPKALKESVTHKDTSIKYQPGILEIGTPRSEVIKAFGLPNGTDTKVSTTEDVYIFLKDGSKYVNPSPRARNVALGVITAGTSVAVRQARLAYQRTELTIYHVFYGHELKILRVEKEAGSAFKLPYETDQ